MQFDLKTYLKENTKKKIYQIKAYRRTENFEQEIENFLVFMSEQIGTRFNNQVLKKLNKERINFDPIYMNLKTDSLYQSKYGILKPNSSQVTTFTLVEKKPVMNWKITKESQKILGYSCYKATTKFRGREYIAWFTPDIPYNLGPWKLGGLPGLILKVENDVFDYAAIRIVLNSDKLPTLPTLQSFEKFKTKYTLNQSIEYNDNWLNFLRSNSLASLPQGVKVIEEPLRKDARELSFDE